MDACCGPVKNIGEVAAQTKPRVFLIDKPNAEQSVILAGHLVPSTKAQDRIERAVDQAQKNLAEQRLRRNA